ncbi:hypothetical protein GWC95_15105 [Sediminibacterium roseum]|uniref:Uncharacterized protein n=1 Tax=Sediminibacterium roseum TaxID=1978412 RepID=A0ABX0A225_9BACT|nr:hypothetical protein [Sediminibacterium roseum]
MGDFHGAKVMRLRQPRAAGYPLRFFFIAQKILKKQPSKARDRKLIARGFFLYSHHEHPLA